MPKSVCRMILGWCFLHHWGLRQKQYIKNWETFAIIFTLYQNLYIMYILYIMYSIYLYYIYILYMTYLCTYLYKDLHKQEFSWGPAGSSHCAKKKPLPWLPSQSPSENVWGLEVVHVCGYMRMDIKTYDYHFFGNNWNNHPLSSYDLGYRLGARLLTKIAMAVSSLRTCTEMVDPILCCLTITLLKCWSFGVQSYPLVIYHSYWKCPFIVDLPIKNGDFP